MFEEGPPDCWFLGVYNLFVFRLRVPETRRILHMEPKKLPFGSRMSLHFLKAIASSEKYSRTGHLHQLSPI